MATNYFSEIMLGELARNSAKTINPSDFPEEEFELYSVPAHETSTPEQIKGRDIGSSKQIVSPGMVLLCKINPRINRVWVVETFKRKRQIASTEWIVFERLPHIEPEYLANFLRTADMRDFLASNASGVGGSLMRVKPITLANYPFPLTGVLTQKAITAKLEELLSALDAGVAELKAAQKKLAQYRQSLLKAAVEGRLTAEWRAHNPPQETGAQLLARILQERRARWEAKQLAKFKEQGKTPPKDWQKKYPEPVRPNTSGLPELPEGWVWASLDQLVAESSYGTSVKCSYESNGTPVIRIPNVTGESLDLRDMKFSTEDLGLDEHDPLAVGDVLVIRTNGSIGLVGRAAAVVADLPTPHYFASYLLRLRCTETTCVHRWILTVLTAHTGRQWLESRASSSAGQHNISLSMLLTMPIPLPPLTEQISALTELEASHEVIKLQDQAIDLSIKQSTAQRQNLLRTAFAGQLVPQDPNDEPASALLERIRAERAQHTATRSPRGRRPKERQ